MSKYYSFILYLLFVQTHESCRSHDDSVTNRLPQPKI